ncbi:protein of unknown function (plasmid) [Caballeronia sp. S22]
MHAVNAERESPIKIRQARYPNNTVEQDQPGNQAPYPVRVGIEGFSLCRYLVEGN